MTIRTLLPVIICHGAFAAGMFAQDADHLPNTQPLKWPEAELPDLLMDRAHRFVDHKMLDAATSRKQFWPTTDASAEEWTAAAKTNREHLRTIIGAVDQRLPPAVEYFGATPAQTIIARTDQFQIAQVRWPVLDGVFAEGLLVTPHRAAVASVVLIPDADETPEQLLGLSDDNPELSKTARRLIGNTVELLIPMMVNRQKLVTDDKRLESSDQTNREWLYRQAFHMGRHIIGYEVQKVLAAVDWIDARTSNNRRAVGVAGYGEGGLIAFYAAALDTRIKSTLVSGYFDSREQLWSEPIYRNVWSLLNRFGDAEIASLILPRQLVIEYSETPKASGHKGAIKTPALKRVKSEFARIPKRRSSNGPILIHGAGDTPAEPYSDEAVRQFLQNLGVTDFTSQPVPAMRDHSAVDSAASHARAVQQIESHVQQLVRKSEHVRDNFMLYNLMPEFNSSRWSTERRHAVHDPKKFIEGTREFRRRFYEEAIGRFDERLLPFNARTRKVLETDKWKAYDVVLDVFDDLIAWGVLLIPKDLKPGERRPVVVCQHGRNGIPRDTIDTHKTAYNDFAAKLAERGFVTFAPHNLYRGEDRYRILDRKANSIGCTLFSFIVAQHDQILKWLDTQPFVDGERIAFYGLSYGGETAVRVPTILEKYCLSICSGDFNQWTRKVAATDQPFSFMRTIEWEMPYWNLGHTFDYAEMTYLMVPRPFLVERGHHDRVGRDRWVAHEFAKVRWLYAQLGLVDKVGIEYFQGGHSINGEAAFAFLHKHLNKGMALDP